MVVVIAVRSKIWDPFGSLWAKKSCQGSWPGWWRADLCWAFRSLVYWTFWSTSQIAWYSARSRTRSVQIRWKWFLQVEKWSSAICEVLRKKLRLTIDLVKGFEIDFADVQELRVVVEMRLQVSIQKELVDPGGDVDTDYSERVSGTDWRLEPQLTSWVDQWSRAYPKFGCKLLLKTLRAISASWVTKWLEYRNIIQSYVQLSSKSTSKGLQ